MDHGDVVFQKIQMKKELNETNTCLWLTKENNVTATKYLINSQKSLFGN